MIKQWNLENKELVRTWGAQPSASGIVIFIGMNFNSFLLGNQIVFSSLGKITFNEQHDLVICDFYANVIFVLQVRNRTFQTH